MRRLIARWRREEGSALVEFALVAVLFIMTMLGVLEMGRMILVYTTLANSARMGARYAMVHGYFRPTSGVSAYDQQSGPGNTAEVEAVVKNYAGAATLNTTNLTVTVSYPHTPASTGNYPGYPVDVTVSYTYNPLMGYFGTLLNKTLSSTSEAIITY